MVDPIALQVGPLSIRWYGILYLVALAVGFWVVDRLNRNVPAFKDRDQILDFLFWMFLLGVLVGGRLGYVLFYDLPYFIQNPLKVFAIWEGGMSFHGGLIGCVLVGLWYFKKHRIDFWKGGDLIAIAGALGQGIGRFGNFINRELLGRPILDHRWDFLGVDFGDGILRYPSQLFQAAEGILTFLILWVLFSRHPKKGTILCSYLMLNGLFRVVSEFYRTPDAQIGYLFGFLTLGQILGLIVFLVGVGVLLWLRRVDKA
jgi:phosphatidylglycerol---prolipoprotein diacylglyceryl transferase